MKIRCPTVVDFVVIIGKKEKEEKKNVKYTFRSR